MGHADTPRCIQSQRVSGQGAVKQCWIVEPLESMWPVRGSAWMFGNIKFILHCNIFKAEENKFLFSIHSANTSWTPRHGPDLIKCCEFHGPCLMVHNPAKKWCINNWLECKVISALDKSFSFFLLKMSLWLSFSDDMFFGAISLS